MDKNVEEIILLGKDSIVQLALKLVDEKISIQDFSKIKVLTTGKEVCVSFFNPIKYLPQKSVFHFGLDVYLIDKTVSYDNPVSNPPDYDKKIIPFYTETKETKRNIQFVLDAINKSGEIGSNNDFRANFEDDMEIREYEDYYSILVVSKTQESSYKIEKISGKIYDEQHAHILPPPIFGNEIQFKAINWDKIKE